MTTFQLIVELEKRVGHDEVSRAALGFIQKTIGVCNSLPNGPEIMSAITGQEWFSVELGDSKSLYIAGSFNTKQAYDD